MGEYRNVVSGAVGTSQTGLCVHGTSCDTRSRVHDVILPSRLELRKTKKTCTFLFREELGWASGVDKRPRTDEDDIVEKEGGRGVS